MPSRNDHRNDSRTVVCAACSQTFPPTGRARWCSNACRQAAWRRRHRAPTAPGAELPPPTSPARDTTVYECPNCDARYLGQQYCDDCHTFCRRLGRGGLCPHCDQPVAVPDLVTNQQ